MRSIHARHWSLDPEVIFLNHGSFGACPRPVLEAQSELRARLERQPLHFFLREYPALHEAALAEVASFVGAQPEDIGFVTNATTGVNIVLHSLALEPGDELLVGDHAYEACRNALEAVAKRAGARVVVARLPFPVGSASDIIAAYLSAATARTRLALVDHVTSPTGLVLPVERIVAGLAERGIDTLVDGAHAPGMLPLQLDRIGAAYYAGNCHKWLSAPKGAAILHVRRDRQAAIRPVVVSHGASTSPAVAGRSRFKLELDWTGTSDPTAWLCVPAAIRFLGGLLPGGWPALRRRNRALALEARDLLRAAVGGPPLCPEDMIGTLAAVALPPGPELPPGHMDMGPLQLTLWEQHRIEVPIIPFPGPTARLLRVSAHAYNDRSESELLARALTASM